MNPEERLRLVQQLKQQRTYDSSSPSEPEQELQSRSTFGIRMFVALLLFAGYFFMEKEDLQFYKINTKVIREQICCSTPEPSNIIDFMEHFTYTLSADADSAEAQK